jgi:very-short-patch-repair endonuclease
MKKSPTSPTLPTSRARKLRREQTETERKLWMRLRGRQLANAKFRRQQPIGRFITDFCCLENGLVIELDGGQHVDASEKDRERTAFLERRGFRVLRFWNHDVLQNMEVVLEQIAQAVEESSKHPHPIPLPEG